MGKQIQIFSTEKDIDNFEAFIRSNYKCEIYQSFSPTLEGLKINNFNDTYYKFNTIYIWNTEYAWNPTFKQTDTPAKLFYHNNTSNAPLIEFEKTNWEKNERGRIYWSKYFSSNELLYDVNEFDKFYAEIVNWIKKNAKGKIKYQCINDYYLEDACIKHMQEFKL